MSDQEFSDLTQTTFLDVKVYSLYLQNFVGGNKDEMIQNILTPLLSDLTELQKIYNQVAKTEKRLFSHSEQQTIRQYCSKINNTL